MELENWPELGLDIWFSTARSDTACTIDLAYILKSSAPSIFPHSDPHDRGEATLFVCVCVCVLSRQISKMSAHCGHQLHLVLCSPPFWSHPRALKHAKSILISEPLPSCSPIWSFLPSFPHLLALSYLSVLSSNVTSLERMSLTLPDHPIKIISIYPIPLQSLSIPSLHSNFSA